MKRREMLTATAAATAGLALGRHATAKTPQPNILFIMTDQQAAGMMSCAGNKWLKTPALDSIAASGIRFERAYAANPVCIPNRYSLQTGLAPSAIGMGENKDSKQTTIAEEMIRNALGAVMRRAGYDTVYGGKTHLPGTMRDVRDLGYRVIAKDSRQGLADACADYLKQPHDKPFFLFASFINPHDICHMALNAERRAKGGKDGANVDSKMCEKVLDEARNSKDLDAFVRDNCPPLPANHGIPAAEAERISTGYTEVRSFREYVRRNWTENDWRLHRWAYCRLTEMVDKEIGTILDALREAGLEENTLVVFTSDHGDMDSAHKLEHKSILYEEAARIPFLMSYKGKIPAGVVDDRHLVSNGFDLLPTLCDYAGVATPKGRPGSSVRPLAEGKDTPDWRDDVVVESQNGRMLRSDRFKYCVYDSGENREQLIDLENDPGEMENLAGARRHKAVLEDHRRRLRKWVENTGDTIGARYIV